jgi:beta-N-acetylhexosaminidase
MIRSTAFLLCLWLAMPSYAKERYQQPAPIHLDKAGEKWARTSLKKMSLEQKIGQMFMIWAFARFTNFNGPDYTSLRDTMRKYHIGGFALTVSFDDGLLDKEPPLEAAMLTNQLQRDSEFPLWFAADFERGLAYRLTGVTNFPHAMAFGATRDPDYAREYGRITAQEARAIGVQWNWFPDADVNSDPDNPIINTRSFGEDPAEVSDMVAAYVEGARAGGMLTTAKHFPGHGDTDIDSHRGVPVINADRAHLDSIEFPPFQAAIKAGVDAIMVAHIEVPALDPDPNHVASISPAIVTGLLKQQMGFKGIVVTDALQMQGLLKLFPEGGSAAAGRIAVEAVKAGDDVLIIPSDLDGAYNGLLQAVRSGEIPESRIDQSVLKILEAKAEAGLNKAKLVDLDAVSRLVATPQSQQVAQEIADESITLVRDNHQALPLEPTTFDGTNPSQPAYHSPAESRGRTLLLIFTPDVRTSAGWMLDRQFRARIPDAQTIYISPRNAAVWTQAVTAAVAQAQTVIAAVYLNPQGGAMANMAALTGGPEGLLHSVVATAAAKTVVLAMGNPYLARSIPEVQNYLCAFSDAEVSEVSAVQALFGEIPTPGRLPITIPGIAARGTGLNTSKGEAQ